MTGVDAGPTACLICRGKEHREVFDEFGVAVLRCRGCGHVFSSWKNHPDYDEYWGDDVGEEVSYWDEAHDRMYDDFLRRFVRGRAGRLLDVGCGLGFFVRAVAREPGWEADGCEISTAAVKYANETLGLARVVSGRLEDAGLPAGAFDAITMWDVIEHLPEPDGLLRTCRDLLGPDGFLFLHTPNAAVQLPKARFKKLVKGMDPGVHYLEAKDHVHLFTPPTMHRLLERNGFGRVEFTHLHPIQAVSGHEGAVRRAVKNAWYETSRTLAFLSRGHLNLDNLFVVARR